MQRFRRQNNTAAASPEPEANDVAGPAIIAVGRTDTVPMVAPSPLRGCWDGVASQQEVNNTMMMKPMCAPAWTAPLNVWSFDPETAQPVCRFDEWTSDKVDAVYQRELVGRVSFHAFPPTQDIIALREAWSEFDAAALQGVMPERMFVGQVPRVYEPNQLWFLFRVLLRAVVQFDSIDFITKANGPCGCLHMSAAPGSLANAIPMHSRILVDCYGVWVADNDEEAHVLDTFAHSGMISQIAGMPRRPMTIEEEVRGRGEPRSNPRSRPMHRRLAAMTD